MQKYLVKIIIFYVIYFATLLKYNAQTFPWATSATGSGTDEGIAICNDVNGNVFVTGQFTSPVITFGTYTLSNSGSSTVFLTKYNANGNVLWAKKAVSTSDDYGNSVTADALGNVFVTGYFASPTISFGSYTLTNSGNYDIFIVKYDAGGNVLWAKSAGGAGNDNGYSAKTDGAGNIYLTGSFGSSIIVFGSYTLTNSGVLDAYLVKYDTNGNVLWAKNPMGSGADESWSVCPDANGNVYFTGDYISPTMVFGTYTITNLGACSLFLAKYDGNGNALWVKNAEVSNFDKSNWVTVDAAGNALISGDFSIPSLIFGSYTLTNNGNSDAFITKYNTNGNIVWAKAAGGLGYDKGYSLSTDANNIYSTGCFTNNIIFGSYTLTAPANAPDPMFIVTYDYSGNVKCASSLISGGDDQNGISADNMGYAYFTSDFKMSPCVIGATTLVPTGGENVFVAKYLCDNITDIKNNDPNLTTMIFPNPNAGNFKIEFNGETDKEEMEFVLINSIGQKVYEQKITNQKNNINTVNMEKGLYHYIILKSRRQINKGKLVIE